MAPGSVELTLAPGGVEPTVAPGGVGLTLAPGGVGLTAAPGGVELTVAPAGVELTVSPGDVGLTVAPPGEVSVDGFVELESEPMGLVIDTIPKGSFSDGLSDFLRFSQMLRPSFLFCLRRLGCLFGGAGASSTDDDAVPESDDVDENETSPVVDGLTDRAADAQCWDHFPSFASTKTLEIRSLSLYLKVENEALCSEQLVLASVHIPGVTLQRHIPW